jgi:hypothetical protein
LKWMQDFRLGLGLGSVKVSCDRDAAGPLQFVRPVPRSRSDFKKGAVGKQPVRRGWS